MLKKKIAYTDYNDIDREEEFYFNVSRAELIDMNFVRANGNLEEHINRITNTKDPKELYTLFRDIVTMSYGEKSLDGKSFIKDPEKTKAFEQTEAFSELIMELLSSEDAAIEFINGIRPKTPEDRKSKGGEIPSIAPNQG